MLRGRDTEPRAKDKNDIAGPVCAINPLNAGAACGKGLVAEACDHGPFPTVPAEVSGTEQKHSTMSCCIDMRPDLRSASSRYLHLKVPMLFLLCSQN